VGHLILGSFGQLVGRWSVSRLVSKPLVSLVVSLFSGQLLVGRLLDQLSGPLVVRSFSGQLENIEIEEEGNADNDNDKQRR
jgi:hypothetical protein